MVVEMHTSELENFHFVDDAAKSLSDWFFAGFSATHFLPL